MNKDVHFPNPPITEALLDIRVNLPSEVKLQDLLSFQEDIKSDFSEKKERHTGSFQIKTGAAPEMVSSSDRTDGYLFLSKEKNKIVQARLDGFTFNKLKPYSDWDKFSGEAKYLWEHYVHIAKPVNIVRLALRYINRILIPLPFKDFKEYILTTPEVAPGISQTLAGYFFQLVIPNPEINATAIVTETIEKIDDKAQFLPLIFDIDVSRNIILEPSSVDIWKIMGELRSFKNQIFLNSLTERAKELFK
jgi:uncharacterized protein (TIGR04255 family)